MPDRPEPLVTVILPFRNAEATLGAAIRSILLQTDRRWVLRLIDDGSSDGSLAVARAFVSPSVSVHSDGRRLGISHRLNAAIAEAATPYIARMDADDIAFPQRFEEQLDLIASDSALDVVASPVLVFRSDGSVPGLVLTGGVHNHICASPWRGFIFPHPTWLGKTAFFRRFPYDPRDDGAEDQALLYRAHNTSRFATTTTVLLAYREDTRTFAKLLHRRRKFWAAVTRTAPARGAWRDLLLLSLLQPAKIATDVLNTGLGLKSARHQLQPAGPQLRADWQAIEKSVTSPPA